MRFRLRIFERLTRTNIVVMPPRLNLFTSRSVAFRTKATIPQKRLAPGLLQQRWASDNASKQPATTPVDPDFKGPNMDPLPHVTEEQAALDKTMGETPPDIQQGTPVQEVSQKKSRILVGFKNSSYTDTLAAIRFWRVTKMPKRKRLKC